MFLLIRIQVNYWYYYSLSFGDDLKMRLGCLSQCKEKAAKLRKEFLDALPEHKAFMSKVIGSKEAHANQEFENNSKITFETPAELASIPPLNAVQFAPPLEFLPIGYMNMINAPKP